LNFKDRFRKVDGEMGFGVGGQGLGAGGINKKHFVVIGVEADARLGDIIGVRTSSRVSDSPDFLIFSGDTWRGV
jgi:hypothetical protein